MAERATTVLTSVARAEAFVASSPGSELAHSAHAFVPLKKEEDAGDGRVRHRQSASTSGLSPMRASYMAQHDYPYPHRIVFKYADDGGFNHGQCRIVVVADPTALRAGEKPVEYESNSDVPIATIPDMIPIGVLHETEHAKLKHGRGLSGSQAAMAEAASASSKESRGNYLVLAERSELSPLSPYSSKTTGASPSPSVALQNQWSSSWYDRNLQQFVACTSSGAYRVCSLMRPENEGTDSRGERIGPAAGGDSTTNTVPNGTAPSLPSDWEARPGPSAFNPDSLSALDAKLSPGRRFLLVQSTASAITLYSVQDRSQEWEIKCRGSRMSRKGANVLVTGGSFFLGDNEVVLVSQTGIECYVYIETKRQWKKGQTLKHPVGSLQALPEQRLAMLIRPVPSEALEEGVTPLVTSSKPQPAYRRVAKSGTPIECMCVHFNEANGSKAGTDATVSLTKFPSFFLDSGAVGGFIGATGHHVSTVYLCRLYTRVYCVSLDTVSMSLSVVDVAGSVDEQIPVARSFPLYGEGRMLLSVVDNLLCVHVPAIRVTLVYDIASEEDRPVANPMSLTCMDSKKVRPEGGGEETGMVPSKWETSGRDSKGERSSWGGIRSKSTAGESSSNWSLSSESSRRSSSHTGTSPSSLALDLHSTTQGDHSKLDPYGDDWQFYFPHWAVHTAKYIDSSGDNIKGKSAPVVLKIRRVWRLQVNLVGAIRCSFGSSPGVVTAFLMRRSEDGFMTSKVQQLRLKGKETRGTYAKYLLLSELLSCARDGVDLGKIVTAFNVLSQVYRVALAERANQITAKKHGKAAGSKAKANRLRKDSFRSQDGAAANKALLNPSASVLAEEHNKRDASISNDRSGRLLKRRVSMVPPTVSVQAVRTLGGMIVVLQRDVFKHVIQPLLADPSVKDDWAYAIMFEYLRSLQRFQIPVEKYIFIEAFNMLLSMGKQRHAVQLLQYHVPPDSLRLARMLLACEELNDPAQAENTRKAIVQAAIDMMMRLHAYNEVVLELLKRGRLMAAMRIVLRHRHRFVRGASIGVEKHTVGGQSRDNENNGGNSSAPSLSSHEPSIPKEAFFRVAVAQLRETASRVEEEEKLRSALTSCEGNSEGGNNDRRVGCGGSAGGGCRLETLHAVYAFYRELWPFLLRPILKYAGGVAGGVDKNGDVGETTAKTQGEEAVDGGTEGSRAKANGGKRGSVSATAATQISTLAASVSFPEDLFDDHRVSAMYRSLFGFAPE